MKGKPNKFPFIFLHLDVDDLDFKIEKFIKLAFNHKVFGPYKRPDGRQIVIVRQDNGSTRTVSYPKYLLEQHLGRQLDPNTETVDHIDNNIDNNKLDNLRILPRGQHSKEDTRRVELIDLTCDECHRAFQRSPRLLRDRSSRGNTGIFCSKSCAGKYARKLQLGRIRKLPVQPAPSSKYYRLKNRWAIILYLLEKYG